MQATHIANPVRVYAAIILAVCNSGIHDTLLQFEGGVEFIAPPEMTARHNPQPGDYLVTQEDGYQYLNPKDVFETKYSPIADGTSPTTASAAPAAKKQSKKAGADTVDATTDAAGPTTASAAPPADAASTNASGLPG